MTQLRIAHISDLHVGHESRGLDMCPHVLPESERIGRNSDYVGVFERFVKSDEFLAGGPIDMLCITGDISNRAHAEEFVFADRAIKRIAAALEVPEDNIYFVPGNHDVHWPVMALQPTNFWSQHRYAPLLQTGLTFHGRVSASAIGAIHKSPFFVAWAAKKALVVGINTAAYDGPDDDLHPGFVRQETIDELGRYLETLPIDQSFIRLCLLHHHPIQYSEPDPNANDPTIVGNAENLLELLSKHCFDLVLHGHKHQPRLKTHQINNNHPFVSLCAGSFSAILNPLHFDGSSNLFHVVNVQRRDSVSDGIVGTVQSWTHLTGKWVESHQNRGIPAVEAFGSHLAPKQVRGDILSAVKRHMENQEHCVWSDVLTVHPHLEHVRTDLAHRLLGEVSHELGYGMIGDKSSPERQWVVYRRTR